MPESLTNYFTERKFNNYKRLTGASVSLDFTSLTDDVSNLKNTGFQIVDNDDVAIESKKASYTLRGYGNRL